MPTIAQNYRLWNEDADWSRRGEQWSDPWGGSAAQWFGCILPRLCALLPTGCLLEIGSGYGRWTSFLLEHCRCLLGIDLAPRCTAYCRARFATEPRASFHETDGKSLDMIADGAVDLVFSFDSLVHAELDVIDAYLEQLARKLAPSGVGFIHHSNMAAVTEVPAMHWRATSVSAALFATACEKHGLVCVRRELINWCTEDGVLNDCFSVFCRESSPLAQCEKKIENNPCFMHETELISTRASLYNLEGGPCTA